MAGKGVRFMALALAVMVVAAGFSHAVDFPRKRINMTILFGAGAGADVVGRKLADLAGREIGQNIVCVNRVGGGGAVGYQYILNQPADGYNICWNSTSINVVYHQGNMSQDYAAFDGVCNVTKELTCLAVRADAPWKTLEEFVEYAKGRPGEVAVANSGIGSFNHLIAAALEDQFGVKFKHIPLNSNESTTALLGGKVDAIVNMAFDIIQQVEAGTMRALVVVGDQRLDKLPGVPYTKELGYDFDLAMWRGITVRKGTPPEAIAVLERAFSKVAQSKDFKDFAERYGVIVDVRSAKEFDVLMAESDQIVAGIMDRLGIKKQ